MNSLLIALKRTLRPGFVLMLALLFLCVSAAGRIGSRLSLRPCGIYLADTGEKSAELRRSLTEKGFVFVDSRRELEELIENGSFDCGAVLCDDIAERIDENELTKSVAMLSSPMSFLTELYQGRLRSVLFTLSSPARTMQAAGRMGLELELDELKNELKLYFDGGSRFVFDLKTVSGRAPAEQRRPDSLRQATAAVLLPAVLFPALNRAAADTRRIGSRIGRKKALRHILLPMTLCCGLLGYAAVLAGFGGQNAAALGAYCAVISALAILSSLLPVGLNVLLPGLLLGGLALYPVYYDLAAVNGIFAYLRLMFPPCWLPAMLGHPLLSLSAGTTLLISAFLIAGKGEKHDQI